MLRYNQPENMNDSKFISDIQTENEIVKQDRDTWKKACELACIEITDSKDFLMYNGISREDDFYDIASKLI